MTSFAFDRVAHIGWVVVWAAAVGVLIFITWRRRQAVAGLALAYLGVLSLVHWLSAVAYTLPWQPFNEAAVVAEGFRISTLGVVAFVVGWCLMARRRPVTNLSVRQPCGIGLPIRSTVLDRLPRQYLTIGGLLWLVVLLIDVSLPSIGAVVSTGQNLFIAGLCVTAWQGWHQGKRQRVWGIITASLFIPLATTTTLGFIGYGVALLVVLVCFVAAFYRPRWHLILMGIVAFYGGLSLYHTYMTSRDALRAVVWGGSSYEARFSVVGSMLLEMEPLDLHDIEFLQQVDARLNQNYLIGAAADYIEKTENYADGETMWMAAVALVPRILWPDKPVQAGSMGLVSKYTGIYFAEETSVGMGHPFELYINFGIWGVIAGLVLLGMTVAWVDRRAAIYLRQGRWDRFALWFVPGIGLVQVGGSFVELTSSVAASLVLVVTAHTLLLARRRNRHWTELSCSPRRGEWSSTR